MSTSVTLTEGHGGLYFARYTLAASETGQSVDRGRADRTVQAYGDFFGATVTFEGSCDPSNSPAEASFFALTDPSNVAISFTIANGAAVTEYTKHIRPVVTGGNSGGTTAISVIIQHRST